MATLPEPETATVLPSKLSSWQLRYLSLIHIFPDFALTLTDPLIVAGIFIGAMMPFMFAALTMGAVSRAAHAMVCLLYTSRCV